MSHLSLMLPRARTAIPILAGLVLVVAACTDGDAATPTPSAETTAEPAATVAPSEPATALLGGAGTGGGLPGAATLAIGEAAPELTDLVYPDGSRFDLADFAGSNTLLFFGYARCPDVCPQTIGEIFGVFTADPEALAVFVSVDPERDTPDFLAEWTEYMPEQFTAVTGSPGAIRRAADDYGVKYARVETTSTAGYTMSHTANVYLIDEAGQLRSIYPFGTPAAAIVADLDELKAG